MYIISFLSVVAFFGKISLDSRLYVSRYKLPSGRDERVRITYHTVPASWFAPTLSRSTNTLRGDTHAPRLPDVRTCGRSGLVRAVEAVAVVVVYLRGESTRYIDTYAGRSWTSISGYATWARLSLFLSLSLSLSPPALPPPKQLSRYVGHKILVMAGVHSRCFHPEF